MSFWSRVTAAFGARKSTGEVAIEGDRVILQDLERAKGIPQEPRESGPKEMEACKHCSNPLRRVVFTTAGGGDQLDVWRQYPLAVDGWLCRSCGWSAVPRFISAEESVEYGRQGTAHATSGQFDDAEFWFRRIVSSWPGYAAGYADLGRLSTARADASTSVRARHRYRSDAEAWFRRAVAADPECRIAGARVALAQVLALNGDEREALQILDRLLGDPALEPSLRTEAETLASGVRGGKALFTRATEMSGELALEPPSKPLSAADRELLEEASALLRQAAQRMSTFATSWYLGKVEMRLGNLEVALSALQRAHTIDPDQPDGCRELGSVYLELDRAQEALPIVRRAAELRPGDAGLRCNLGLILLFTGDVAAARAEVTAALALEPNDTVTRGVLRLIDEVVAGRRQRPSSLAEAEGRRRCHR